MDLQETRDDLRKAAKLIPRVSPAWDDRYPRKYEELLALALMAFGDKLIDAMDAQKHREADLENRERALNALKQDVGELLNNVKRYMDDIKTLRDECPSFANGTIALARERIIALQRESDGLIVERQQAEVEYYRKPMYEVMKKQFENYALVTIGAVIVSGFVVLLPGIWAFLRHGQW